MRRRFCPRVRLTSRQTRGQTCFHIIRASRTRKRICPPYGADLIRISERLHERNHLLLFISSTSFQTFDLLRLTGNSDIRAARLPFTGAPITGAALIRPPDAGGVDTAVVVEVFLNFSGGSVGRRLRRFLGCRYSAQQHHTREQTSAAKKGFCKGFCHVFLARAHQADAPIALPYLA